MALCFSRNYAVIKVDKFSEWHGSKTGSASKDSYRISRVSVCKDCDSKNENREPIERTPYTRFFFFFLFKMDHSMIFLLKFLLWTRE